MFLNADGSVYGGFDGFFPGGSFPGCYPSACQPAGIVQLDAHDEVNRAVARMPPGGTGFFGITDLDPFRTSSGLVYGLAASVDSAASIFANSYDGLAWVFRAGCGDACPAFAGQAAVGDGSDATGVAADAADGAIFIAGQSQSPSVSGDVHVAKVTDLGLSPPCDCRTLSTSTARYADNGTQATFDVHWLLTCAPGGGDCRGRIEVVPPAGTDIKIQNQKAGVNCILTCSPTQVSTTSGSFTVVATSKHSLARNKRRGKTFKYRIEKWCVIGGVANQEPTSTLTVVYRRDGRLDRSRSDLNADGRPDGSKKD